MNKKTRVLTLSALFSALSLISLYIASVWPTGQLGLAAFASLFVMAAVIESGLLSGVYVYVISSALAVLLLPTKTAPLLYVLFFGFYPMLKYLIERLKKKPLQWVIKLLVFNVSLCVIYFILKVLVFDFADTPLGAAVLVIGSNVIFALFDYGFSKVIGFYMERIHR